MKTRVLVSLEEIDNGWLNPARRAATCAVAQAVIKFNLVCDSFDVAVLNNAVLLTFPGDMQRSVFTTSLAFSEWISTFDQWTALRQKYQDQMNERSELRKRGVTHIPPMPAMRGKPAPPVVAIIDTEERHVSIENEPESKSGRAFLPVDYRAMYLNGICDNMRTIRRLSPNRRIPLQRYLERLYPTRDFSVMFNPPPRGLPSGKVSRRALPDIPNIKSDVSKSQTSRVMTRQKRRESSESEWHNKGEIAK